MPAKIIDGKKLADKILKEVKNETAKLDHKPGLAAILIGDNPASKMYLKLKEKACHKAGIDFHSYLLDSDCTEDKILHVIDFLNTDPEIHGILIQLPLPENFNTDKIIKAIDPTKEIDSFQSQSKFTSPNVLGIIELIKSTGKNLKNKKITVLSNSKIFAEPFKDLLKDSNVEYLNPESKKLNLKDSDVLIVAIGKAKFIKPEMIKKDTILIDVGINKVKDRTVGDIDPSCDKVASWRSPVPGGVGPMTVAKLLENLTK